MGQKIITIAAIVFALVFVLILAVMMGTITNKANTANTQLADTLNMTDATGLDRYDNVTLKGESVVDACKSGSTIGGDTRLFMVVETKDGQNKVYGYGTSGGGGDLTPSVSAQSAEKWTSYNLTNSSDPGFINRSAEFSSELVRNKNNIVVGILFTQK